MGTGQELLLSCDCFATFRRYLAWHGQSASAHQGMKASLSSRWPQSLGPWRQLLVRFVGLRGAPSCTLHAARLRGAGGGGTLSAPAPAPATATAAAPEAATADSAPGARVSSEGLERTTVLGEAQGGEQAVGGPPQPIPQDASPAPVSVPVLPLGPSAAYVPVHPSTGASQRQQLREVLRLAAAQQGGWGAGGGGDRAASAGGCRSAAGRGGGSEGVALCLVKLFYAIMCE